MIVAIVGPESSGKTTLAMQLAKRFDAPWLPEFARDDLAGRPGYDEADLERIARGQLAAEQALLAARHPLVVLDTDLIVIHVWWQEKYGHVPAWVAEQLRGQPPRCYLLARPDLAWEPDPLRESPRDRERLLDVYRDVLDSYDFAFSEITGQGEARSRQAEVRIQQERLSE